MQLSLHDRVASLIVGVIALAFSSQLAIPMSPTPITLQTLAVTLVGGLMGWRWGLATVLIWLGLGALGVPVFANGAGGASHLIGPTGGYLIAFPIAAVLVGRLVERGWDGRRPLLALAVMLMATALCLVLGGLWLATSIGVIRAWSGGVEPFLVGGLIKSVLGAAVLFAVAALIDFRRDRSAAGRQAQAEGSPSSAPQEAE